MKKVNYFTEHYKFLQYPISTKDYIGLRNAQIGAIHAISSYFTLNKAKAAMVTMPTGSGKTAVLMMTPYILQAKRILVITPSKMVRSQITDDFKDLSTLCKAGVFKSTMKKPDVTELEHTYSPDNFEEILKYNVIVSTPRCALTLTLDDRFQDEIDIVLVDEAHHTPAVSWTQILLNLHRAKHILFTATPFRMDRKEIKGEMIYNYPLSLAYADGIFGEIEYIPIEGIKEKDKRIALKAQKVLISDREKGFNHYLMVRTNGKDEAKSLEELYQEVTDLRLKRIDSSMSNNTVKKCIAALKEGKLDGIICVDMLGEGFDFPNLKIAAIHSPHKSLANTLQFIGRFARTNAENIGTAKFIAMNDEELEIENNHLYTNDSVWQDMVIDLSENRTKNEEQKKKYFESYSRISDGEKIDEEEISLYSIRPNCHAKVYRVYKFDINGVFPKECNIINGPFVNENDNTVIAIGQELSNPKWLSTDMHKNKEYMLFIIHFQKETDLLFIYSQSKTEYVYRLLVEAFCDKSYKVPQYQMNRVLGNLKEFEIFNSGMQNRYNESGESYQISAGSNLGENIDPSTGKIYSPGHLFCKASYETENITIGYSTASKMWSSSYLPIPEFVEWCDFNGKKIMNKDIKVKTNTNYDYLPLPEELTQYPSNIFMSDFDHNSYISPLVIENNGESDTYIELIDTKISIERIKNNQIEIKISISDIEEVLSCDTEGNYKTISGKIVLKNGSERLLLSDYLNDYPLRFRTTDDVLIQGKEYYKGNPDAILYDSENIVPIDWDEYGTDLSLEVEDQKKYPGKKSIQKTLQEIIEETEEYRYIIFDHASGEIADYITVEEQKNVFEITLYHVKKMSSKNFNTSVNDLYEVVGQAVKSLIWFKTKGILLKKVGDRRKSGHCQFLRGDYDDFVKELRNIDKQIIGKIVVVQPSISKGNVLSNKIQEVLAAGNYYIGNAGKVKKMLVYGSK